MNKLSLVLILALFSLSSYAYQSKRVISTDLTYTTTTDHFVSSDMYAMTGFSVGFTKKPQKLLADRYFPIDAGVQLDASLDCYDYGKILCYLNIDTITGDSDEASMKIFLSRDVMDDTEGEVVTYKMNHYIKQSTGMLVGEIKVRADGENVELVDLNIDIKEKQTGNLIKYFTKKPGIKFGELSL